MSYRQDSKLTITTSKYQSASTQSESNGAANFRSDRYTSLSIRGQNSIETVAILSNVVSFRNCCLAEEGSRVTSRGTWTGKRA